MYSNLIQSSDEGLNYLYGSMRSSKTNTAKPIFHSILRPESFKQLYTVTLWNAKRWRKYSRQFDYLKIFDSVKTGKL